jgi:Ca-activated chloride channel homolog
MNTTLMLLPLLLATVGGSTGAQVRINAGLNTPCMPTSGGQAFLQLSVNIPQIHSHTRHPMNLSVVLDRSGSMADQGKIEYAKKAICSLIDNLRDEDLLSIVIYDDVIEVLRPAGPVSDREGIKNLVRGIYPRNSTNLGGGMLEGFQQVERNTQREYTNRVVLLSDGLANVGITNNAELARIARSHRNRGITLTTMGVGLDYNENLMVSLSESGGGNYYFIESPNGLASIMRREFDLLSSVYAHRATVTIQLGPGVSVRDVIGHEWHSKDGRCEIVLGDLYGGDSRDITIELSVPHGSGSAQVLEGTLHHESEKSGTVDIASFTASVTYTEDAGRVEHSRNMEAQSKADVAVSTRAVEQATKAMDEGDMKGAQQIIGAAKASLQNSPAAPAAGASGALVKEQAERLEEYRSIMSNESDARKTKKEIQYRNYQTQKQK